MKIMEKISKKSMKKNEIDKKKIRIKINEISHKTRIAITK